MKSKIMSLLVVLTLILSGFLVMNTYDLGIVETAKGVRLAGESGNLGGDYILSNDGSGGASALLTCGELITFYVNNNSLDPDEDYTMKVWNGSAWVELDVDGDDSADEYGDLTLDFHVPGWPEIGVNPLTINGSDGLDNGQFNITLFEDGSGGTQIFSSLNITISIGNLYDIRYQDDGDWLDYVIYNASYSEFGFYVYNWTSSGWELEKDDDFDVSVYKSNGDVEVATDTPTGTGYWSPDFAIDEDDIDFSTHGYEVFYWVNVTQNVSGTPNTARHSNATLPVLLNMTADVPTNVEWGDTIDVDGYVLDGRNDAVESGYTVRLYAPTMGANGNYTVAYEASTYSTGRYSMSVETGTGEGYSAGTWFVGTYKSGSAQRAQTGTVMPYLANFIPYAYFVVETKDDARIDVENDDDIVVDFVQTINVSVYNSSWMDNDEYRNMQIHVTGLAAWNESTNTEYTEDDVILVNATLTGYDDDHAWYEFDYLFNDTGTATIIASWPGNGTSILGEEIGEGMDSSYGNTFGNASTTMLPNITGTTTFSVVASDSMNLIVVGGQMVDAVIVNSVVGCSDGYINGSDSFNLTIFGDSQSDPMNASIEINGCGLNIEIDEDDGPADVEELNAKGWGWYNITISPKIAGTLTITATNDTEETSISKDYTVTGLTGTVTTANGDDLKITVGTTEKITVSVTNGQYAHVYVTYFDNEWSSCNSLNDTLGDGTEGEGLNGVFTFIPDVDDLENVGYIVVAAQAGSGNWMYDIIDVEPIYDLTIELISPSLENATPSLTVGLEQDVAVKLLDSNGDEVDEDSPTVIGKLIDDDHDEDNPLQTFDFSSSGGDWEFDDLQPYWSGQLVITGTNDTGETEHSGNLTLDVSMATITYSPMAYTAGIGIENVTLTVSGTDANGDPLPDNTRLYFWVNDSDTFVWDTNNYVNLDDGVGEIDIEEIGDNQTIVNATFANAQPNQGNRSLGVLNIYFPTFNLNPDTVFIGQSNLVEITATDHEETPIQGINLTFVSSIPGILSAQPDPVQTDADGVAQLSINPLASGKLNVTIARDIAYENGQLNWSNAVITDTYLTATSIQQMKISLSKSPIYEGQTLTVTVTSGTNTLSDVDVEFGETTVKTDSNGQATFTAPDPGVESAVYTITAEKSGYVTAEKSITVIKIWDITIIAPSKAPAMGEEFTLTILAKGSPLAGAIITFNGKTYTSGADGKLTITAPDKAGDYTVTASYEDYNDATVTITIKEGGGIPGFELLTLVAALGVAFILLRRRR